MLEIISQRQPFFTIPRNPIIQAVIATIIVRWPPLLRGTLLVVVPALTLRFVVVVVVEGTSTEIYIEKFKIHRNEMYILSVF